MFSSFPVLSLVAAIKPPAVASLKFEAALAELEDIARNMEGGNLELEQSIAAYRRGVELLKHCRQQLTAAEEQVRILEDNELKPFTDEAGA